MKDAGESVAKRRIEAYEAAAKQITGDSPSARAPRRRQLMTGHPDNTLNLRYALRSVAHYAARREYTNRFVAFPISVRFRPPRVTPAPRIGGSQTALVVGPSGKEIHTDKYGRVKVQFHWDQLGTKDENSSCWIRVAQNWAGVSWGAFGLPRIGQEVVVTFLDGDPDRPLITSCVYNGDNPVPYALPDEQTKTVPKSNSSEGGGFNELRLEDKKGSEDFYIHAHKDMTVDVLNDQTVTVTQDRAVTISEGKDTLAVSKGDPIIIGEQGQGDAQRGKHAPYERDRRRAPHQQGRLHAESLGQLDATVDGDITIKASGTITLQSGNSLTVKAGTALAASGGTSAEVKSGTGITLQRGTTATLKAGASATVDGGGTLALEGGIVQLN